MGILQAIKYAVELLYHLSKPLPSIFSRELNARSESNICVSLFIAVFPIAKVEGHRVLSDGWTGKQNLQNPSAFETEGVLMHAKKWMKLKDMQNKIITKRKLLRDSDL